MSKFAEYSTEKPALPPLKELGLIIRDAGVSDIPETAVIQAKREIRLATDCERSLRAFLDQTTAHLMVAEFDGHVIGLGKCRYLTRPPDAPTNCVPEGWYLAGLVVDPPWRRRGTGLELTLARIAWVLARSSTIYYFARDSNAVSIELHSKLGFVELARGVTGPGFEIADGNGVLFRLEGKPS